jgi:putative ABC transport system permease protein
MKHNLQLAWRGYVRERAFTTLNLMSLTIGLFVAYVTVHYLRFEWSYDRFHQHARSVYRLAWSYRSQAYSVIGFTAEAATAAEQQRQLNAIKNTTGVVDAVQFITSDVPTFVEANGRTIQAKGLLTTNTPRAFCEVFSWSLQAGSFQDFSGSTQTAILTQSTARLLVGDDVGKAIHQRVKVGADYYTIAAIITDVPANSHVNFTVVLNTPRLPYWGSRVYVQTVEGADPEQVTRQINKSMAAFNPRQARDPLYKGHFLQPLLSLHLGSDILYELKPPGNRLYLLLIACFGVCIGCITLVNYANLSLAIKAKQSKSLGVRKAMGASIASIAAQFWVEGVLLALLALPLVAVLVAGLMPTVNRLMGVALPTSVWTNDPLALPLLVGLAVVLGTLASSTTILKLAAKRALALISDTIRNPQRRAIPVRNYLVVSQFVLLIALMAVAYFVSEQIRFVDKKELGFRREGVLYAYTAPEVQDVFQAKLRQLPGVKVVGNGSSLVSSRSTR